LKNVSRQKEGSLRGGGRRGKEGGKKCLFKVGEESVWEGKIPRIPCKTFFMGKENASKADVGRGGKKAQTAINFEP